MRLFTRRLRVVPVATAGLNIAQDAAGAKAVMNGRQPMMRLKDRENLMREVYLALNKRNKDLERVLPRAWQVDHFSAAIQEFNDSKASDAQEIVDLFTSVIDKYMPPPTVAAVALTQADHELAGGPSV